MIEIEIYTRAAITILGVAYPILLQVIARLDEKYASTHIVELFDKERTKKIFEFSLISSLIFILISSLKLKPLFQLKGFNYLINNSANLLVFASVVLLVISFFLFVKKILVYYTPIKFIKYLTSKYNKNYDLRYFSALTEIFLHNLRKQNDDLSYTMSRFFYDVFRKEREKFTSQPVNYPDAYHSLVNRAIEELAILKNKKNTALEYRIAGGIWLIGEMKDNEISDTTYTWLWRNILLIIKYEQDDMILFHWGIAHQYFTFNLNPITPEYEENGTFKLKNELAIKKRELERYRFLEFYYALAIGSSDARIVAMT